MAERRIATEFIDAGEMHFEVHTCGDPEAERLALFLHGFPELAYSWRHQLPLLADLGYRAWAPNQRGYGRTTRPARVADYHIDHLLQDVAALIDASGAKSVTLIGHDWGGLVAWIFAIRQVRVPGGTRPIDSLSTFANELIARSSRHSRVRFEVTKTHRI